MLTDSSALDFLVIHTACYLTARRRGVTRYETRVSTAVVVAVVVVF